MPTLANPFIKPEEVEAAKRNLTERQFAQEFLAEFGLDEDSVFRNIETCLSSKLKPDPEPNRTYVAGVDLARLSDYTVITILNDLGQQVALDRFRHTSWESAINRIVKLCRRFSAPAVIDATGLGDPIIEQIQSSGLAIIPFRFTAVSKEPLIQSLAVKLEQNRLQLLNHQVQTNELMAYQATRSPSGAYRYSAPPGHHDDCVIALALAASQVGKQPFTIFDQNR